MIPYRPPQAVRELPVIDVGCLAGGSGRACREAAAAVRRACLDTGFFYVANHGIEAEVIAAQFAASRRFFALPQADKLALDQARSPYKRGYEPPGRQVLDDGSPADLKESFRFGPTPTAGHPYAQRRLPTYGPSQWPDALPGMRDVMERYLAEMTRLGDGVLSLVARSLELEPAFFAGFYRHPMATVRLLRYPPQPAGQHGNLLGAGAHTDWGGITILAQDEVGGLEVCNVAGEWVSARPIPGTFVVNLGEMLGRWTNERYRSNLHRVRNARPDVDRYSAAFFYDPEYDARIECLPSCLAPGETPRHPACTSGEHIAAMHRRTTGTAKAAA
ncbi:isopenicillin N synthase family oxygenase [Verticiella sediminum]|uniref:2-oxoglutarate-dependent ethylene/succinate-forming enzyme n=1 Tax=Verticiella sediminum TaxID=1247510 RepID=A0A556AQ33_9BURK|nr:2-oxoglutarate and iron-dependent oxygenase domain-containing protein [Verticiella sediminum]TSH94990.1 isopenicillin N synthase family oxygenase [Verticiella sediminum]